MKPGDLFGLALSRLGTGKMRTALTMLGIIIGVASVVALVSVAQGATKGISDRLQSLGTNLVTVSPGFTRTGATRGYRFGHDTHSRRCERARRARRRAGDRPAADDQQACHRRNPERDGADHRHHARLSGGLRLPDVDRDLPQPGLCGSQPASGSDRIHHRRQPGPDGDGSRLDHLHRRPPVRAGRDHSSPRAVRPTRTTR